MPAPADLEHLTWTEPRDGVVLLTLDNPSQRNAMSGAMTTSWTRATAALAADPDVRAVVVTGEGSAFCAGGDVSWLASEPDATAADLRLRMQAFYRDWLSVRRIEVPVLAAVNGPVIGAGLCLALACDLGYAASSAKLGAPFVKLGLHPGMAATHLLVDAVGPMRARDLLLTGRLVEAAEAAAIGLVAAELPDEGFLDAVLDVAAGIAATAPLASRLTTVALREGGHRSVEEAIRWEALAQPVTMTTDDLQKGLAAVRERRTPRFTGR
ncbi:enoyl-CoA hydratase/isomerase family protein [Nocardioidaceae bacterium]|nr:enoyl-CoA hydratase/isomerase family protein [Nocardioidaceae bacterium]